MRPTVRLAWSLMLGTTLLAGCGQGSPSLTSTSASSASTRAYDYDLEPVPTQSQLASLEARSPDALVADAALEPGLQTDGIGPKPPAEDLGNFGKVESTLWRGARPTDKGLAQLQSMGVKTIVNFENDQKVVAHEQAWAQAHGVSFVSIPLSVITPPKLANVNKFLGLAEDPTQRPLYFHCMQGRDRTGTAAFCYRVQHDGWSYDKAYAEMTAYHFHSYLVGLRAFLVWFADTQAATPATAAFQ